ncbi:MAG TPA: 3-isopropylmalate dehydratase small subunit [Devosia sp.]|nr:3-isopropylmalate dehydratase small subunit [Devosia sp.]
MQSFTTLESIAAPLPEADVDTDVIFPARFLLLLDKAGLGKHLFHERRYREGRLTDFVLNRPPYDRAQILVADANFGSGSSREHAVWALADFGIRCVIAPSFGEIFFANCFKNGVLPIVSRGDDHASVMSAAQAAKPLRVDLERQQIALPDGEAIGFDVEPFRRRALLSGLDEIGTILSEEAAAIAAFEREQRAQQPWLWLEDGRMERLVETEGRRK